MDVDIESMAMVRKISSCHKQNNVQLKPAAVAEKVSRPVYIRKCQIFSQDVWFCTFGHVWDCMVD